VARGAEAANPTLALRQLVDLDELDGGKLENHELGDPHARLDDEGLRRVGVEEIDEELAAVAGVDEARRVDDRDAVLGGEP
jgi:hypothetical protein